MTAERRMAEKLERSMLLRRRVLLGGWALASTVLLARAAQIQVVQREVWREKAEAQHQKSQPIPAARGSVVDRDGTELAISREIYRIGLAPHEVVDTARVVERLAMATGLDQGQLGDWVHEDRRWRQLPGKYTARAREALRGLKGVHPMRELERFYPHGSLALGVLGRFVEDGGRGGVEQQFDDLLSGVPGRKIYAHDNAGRPLPGEELVVQSPQAGGSVVLTLDADLQEIGEEIIGKAVADTESLGGDLLITDPKTGDILAMASVRNGNTAALSAINTPYEPGSTLKPITVAGMLERGIASLQDSVDVENGSTVMYRRRLTDVGNERGMITLERALQTSSNVGVAKAAEAMEPSAQFQNLRDFGFGTPTGLGLPGEVSGTLRHPDDWSLQSPASLAIGYEIGVTPLQMAMAYGAIANGGLLMQPRLVREVRANDGTVAQRFETRAIRRVVSEEVADEITDVLVDVVEDGTGTRARLATFSVAGKSGTARAWSPGGYKPGEYFASFAGFFPAEDPQLVVLVKLDRPHGGAYYGGALAAPVTKATLEAILAVRQAPIDRRALATMARATSVEPGEVEDLTGLESDAPVGGSTQLAGWGDASLPELPIAGPIGDGRFAVPDVAGLPARIAARRLHALGFRVEWAGSGTVTEVWPEPGTRLVPGDTVRLGKGRRGDG